MWKLMSDVADIVISGLENESENERIYNQLKKMAFKQGGPGGTILHFLLKIGRIEIVKVLTKIMNLEDILKTDNQGRTALHIAACIGNVYAVRYLIDAVKKVNEKLLIEFINFPDKQGNTALHYAARCSIS